MSLNDVLNALEINWYNNPTLEAEIEAAVVEIYNTTRGGALFESYLAVIGGPISINFEQGATYADSGSGAVYLDTTFAENYTYINEQGIAVQEVWLGTLAHELVHALTGIGHSDWRNDDAYLDEVTKDINILFGQLNIDKQVSAPAIADVGSPLTIGQNYSLGLDFDRAWVENLADHTSTGEFRDLLIGQSADNVINGGGAEDIIYGQDGFDTLNGGSGNDVIFGGNGSDSIEGGSEDDTLFGDEIGGTGFHDSICGGDGDDEIFGGGGNDTICGDDGEDEIKGQAGDDVIDGGAGDDLLEGGSGNDTIDVGADGGIAYGQSDNDTIYGGEDGGKLYGGSGGDTIYGGSSEDAAAQIFGGSGNDVLHGTGSSELVGGSGADEFHVQAGDAVIDSEGHDKLFFNGVHVTDDMTGLVYGWKNGTSSGDRPFMMYFNNSLLQQPFHDESETFFAEIGLCLVVRGTDSDMYGTYEGIIYDLYIFEDLTFDINTDFDLGSAALVINDFRQGDFGLFGDEHADDLGFSTIFESTSNAVNIVADGFGTVFLERGPDQVISVEDAAAELAFEKIQSALEDTGVFLTDAFGGGPDEVGINDPTTDNGNVFFANLTGLTYVAGDGDDVGVGGGGTDDFDGGDGSDILIGGGGADILSGGNGGDIIFGGEALPEGLTSPSDDGSDIITAGAGDDLVFGGEGADEITGGSGVDTLYGDAGSDSISGGADDDLLRGGDGNDQLLGDDGHDILRGESGEDTLFGGTGSDELFGGNGSDELFGGAEGDTLEGGGSNDILFGGSGVDVVLGDDGDDTIVGGTGDDVLAGGVGNDQYEYTLGDGSDFIIDDGPNAYQDTDRIVFTGVTSTDVTYFWVNDDLIIAMPDGAQVVISKQFKSVSNAGIEYADFSDGITVDLNALELTQQYFGTDEDDSFYGGNDSDYMPGNAGNDHLIGGGGDDSVDGGFGDDLIVEGQGADTYDGGAGIDTLDTSYEAFDTNFDLAAGTLNYNDEFDQVATNFENAITGDGNDEIVGTDGANSLSSNSGNDSLFGFGGNDFLDGGNGNDVVYGGSGDDVLDGGYFGADFLYGGDGDDLIIAGFGVDIFDGGDGVDTLDLGYTVAATSTVFDLTEGTVSFDGGALIETATGFENAFGGAGSDTYIGTNDANTFTGNEGDDTFVLGGGTDLVRFNTGDGTDIISDYDILADGIELNGEILDPTALPNGVSINQIGSNVEITYGDGDLIVLENVDLVAWQGSSNPIGDGTITGTAGNDVVDGAYTDDPDGDAVTDAGQVIEAGAGNDLIYDGAGDDTVFGGDDTDTFYAGDGADHYDGGESKHDGVDFSGATQGVVVDLTDATNNAGIAAGDTYVNIEKIVGSSHDDVLIGDDVVFKLIGGGGNDTIVSGTRKNLLTGDGGADTFVFSTGSGDDTIKDFSSVEGDLLDVSGWGAVSLADLMLDDSSGKVVVSFGADSVTLTGITSVSELA